MRPLYLLYYNFKAGIDARLQELLPVHRGLLEACFERGEIIMAGAFADSMSDTLGIWTSRQALDAFLQQDPFLAGGLIRDWSVREFHEMLDSTAREASGQA